MSNAYRSPYDHIVGTRLAEVCLARELVEPLLPRLDRARSARLARVVGGSVGVAGACLVVALAALEDELAACALVLSSVAAALAYVCVRVVTTVTSRRRRAATAELPQLRGQLEADLAALDAIDPWRTVDVGPGRLESWSIALPLAAMTLLTPLTLHFGVAELFQVTTARGFAGWILASTVLVGHAHLALVVLSVIFARKLAASSFDDLAAMPIDREWLRALLITVGVSALPGIILWAIPPILAAITGLCFVPAMFVTARRIVMNDRALLEHLREAAPAPNR